MKILWASVIYPCKMFDTFLTEHLHTIAQQSLQTFDLLLFLDCIQYDQVRDKLSIFNQKDIHIIEQNKFILNPSEIRRELLLYAYKHAYDLIFFSDFDETMDSNRIEETIKQIKNNDFSFSSFYPVDKNLKRLCNIDFQKQRKTPKKIHNFYPILDKNFIGLGNMSIKLKKQIPIDQFNIRDIGAFDWFLATLMLLNNFHGIRIDKTFVNYRQYEDSYIGTDHILTEESLQLGIHVKLQHYSIFSKFDTHFAESLASIEELMEFVKDNKNRQKYIKIINQNFDPRYLCWWENIKPLKEIKQWI